MRRKKEGKQGQPTARGRREGRLFGDTADGETMVIWKDAAFIIICSRITDGGSKQAVFYKSR